MTHRVFSRNASSSRAVPTKKLIEEVRSDALRATFVHWGAEQKGMGADNELTDDNLAAVQYAWMSAAHAAANHAEAMADRGAAKQLVNRLLEPFSHINVLISTTEWDNFFGLRLDKAAQPEMRALAEMIWREWNETEPALLKPGEWHLPFVSIEEQFGEDLDLPETGDRLQQLIKVSVARCARVSYESFETGKRSTVEEDLRLYDRLVGMQPLHASPAEHQATPDCRVIEEVGMGIEYRQVDRGWRCAHEHGNFYGWRQYRKMLAGESCAPLPAGYTKERV